MKIKTHKQNLEGKVVIAAQALKAVQNDRMNFKYYHCNAAQINVL